MSVSGVNPPCLDGLERRSHPWHQRTELNRVGGLRSEDHERDARFHFRVRLSMPRSTVNRTSNSPLARLRRVPFLIPAHPASCLDFEVRELAL